MQNKTDPIAQAGVTASDDGTATGLESPTRRAISIIVPTYNEAENLESLTERVASMADRYHLDAELLLMDDGSCDGTEKVVADLDLRWVRLVALNQAKGRDLSKAVLRGLDMARHEILVVMDADLSHPPEAIPEMLSALDEGSDFVVGSRYVCGGSTEDGWGILRKINSLAAVLLARPFTHVKDPMTGFFMLTRQTLEGAAPLDPTGYKIALELMVKCRVRRVAELPIRFATRRAGYSKLSLVQQWRYLRHVGRLARFKLAERVR